MSDLFLDPESYTKEVVVFFLCLYAAVLVLSAASVLYERYRNHDSDNQ